MSRLVLLALLLWLATSTTSPVDSAAPARACGGPLTSCVLTVDAKGRVDTMSSVPIGPFTFTLPTSPTFGGIVTAQGFVSNGTGAGTLTISNTAFALLGAPVTGTIVWCSDCDPPTAVNATCTSSGMKTGALAIRSNNVWKCK